MYVFTNIYKCVYLVHKGIKYTIYKVPNCKNIEQY